ncbi:MAG: hypothetical protein JRI87_10480, partial [Deltaproteobacteria bacterium]|nr:hypothetical protein [Deltaproteobacteria bacterium]
MARNRCLIYIVVISILLGGAPLSASVNSDQLERAITMSQGALKADQNGEGYWLSYVQTNTLYTSLQVLLYYYLNKEE